MTNAESHDQHGFVAGVVLGAIAGGAAALLLSPKNGHEMRELLREVANEWQGGASELAQALHEVLDAFQEELDGRTTMVRDQMAPPVAQAIDRTHATFEAAEDRVGERFQQARDSVQEMVESWKQEHAAPSAWVDQETPHHQAAARTESPAPYTWGNYTPTEDYRYYKGGSVSAEPKVVEEEAALSEDDALVSTPLMRRAAETALAEPANEETSAADAVSSDEVPEQPFLAPRPDEFVARWQGSWRETYQPTAESATARPTDEPKPVVKRERRVAQDVPVETVRTPRTRRTKLLDPTAPGNTDLAAEKPAKKMFFKKK